MPTDEENEIDETTEPEATEDDDAAAVDAVFADTDPPPPDVPHEGPGACRFCQRLAIVCEEHAQQLIAHAVNEDEFNRRELAGRSAERAMRRQKSGSTLMSDGEVLAIVIRRWWPGEEVELAKAIVTILEGDPT